MAASKFTNQVLEKPPCPNRSVFILQTHFTFKCALSWAPKCTVKMKEDVEKPVFLSLCRANNTFSCRANNGKIHIFQHFATFLSHTWDDHTHFQPYVSPGSASLRALRHSQWLTHGHADGSRSTRPLQSKLKHFYSQAGQGTACLCLSFPAQGVLAEDQLSCLHSQRRVFLCSTRSSPHSSSLFERHENMSKCNYEWYITSENPNKAICTQWHIANMQGFSFFGWLWAAFIQSFIY